MAFTGSQSIFIPDSPLINTYAGSAATKSIELWFTAANVQSRQLIYAQGNATSGLNLYLDAGQLYFGTWNAGVFGPLVRANVASNVAYHVVGVFSGSTARLYINGVQAASAATAFSGIAAHPGVSSIGAVVNTRFHNATATSGFNFVGTIDEVALYNSALSAQQVATHYRSTGILASDTDLDTADTRQVIKVEDKASNVNQQFMLSSGALLTVLSDGSYQYNPNGAFDYLSASASANDTFTYTIQDASGATSTATVTVTVQGINDAPRALLLSNDRVTLSNVVGTLSTIDPDLGDTVTYTIVGQTTNTFAIQNSQLVVNDRTGLVLGETRVITIDATDSAGATLRQSFALTVTDVPASVGVTSAVVSPSTVKFQFNTPMDLSVLNLYDGVDASVDAADLTIVGAATGAVQGSMIWDAVSNSLTFVKTGSPLAADTYTVTMFSRADGFKSAAGVLLDGDFNGVAGGNYVTSFSVLSSSARVVSIADFARGATSAAGQTVNVTLNNGLSGIPLTINNAADVLAIDVDIVYDNVLLDISTAFVNVLPAGWSTAVNRISDGRVRLTMSGSTPLTTGPREIARVLASVPANVPYGAVNLLRIENLAVYTTAGGPTAVPSIGDMGLHKAIFIGDANSDGQYTAQDAGWIAGVRVGITTGYDAYPWVDPVIVTDVTQNGQIDGLDSAWISRKGLQPTLQPEIPNLPAGSLNPAPGADPTIAADANVPGSGDRSSMYHCALRTRLQVFGVSTRSSIMIRPSWI